MKEIVNLKTIKDKLIKFSKERDWEKFHTPKNLAMALTVEVSELLEIFQWSLHHRETIGIFLIILILLLLMP